ncbi:MAG: DUF721 domain-containing protein [Acidobacteriota bacterium]|nr:DUF721 domain-containing protein [Acidobacteriota bacterium]
MRDILREVLGKSLERSPELDRLIAAWPVACGAAMASRGEVVACDDGEVTVVAVDRAWQRQMESVRETLRREIASIARVRVTGIHFKLRSAGPESPAGDR